MNYTLIGYKPDSSDYCMGCHMTSYDSEHFIICSKDEEHVSTVWADNISPELRSGEACFRITILFNGLELHQHDDTAIVEIEKRLTALEALVEKKVAQNKALQEAEKNKKLLLQKESEAELQRQKDLNELQRLKKLYGET